MRIALDDVAAMCMLLGNVGYAQPNTAQQQQQQQHIFVKFDFLLYVGYVQLCLFTG